MNIINRNWPVTVGLLVGVLAGVAVSKVMEHVPAVVKADQKSARKWATEQAETFRNAAKVIAPTVVSVVSQARAIQQGGLFLDRFGRFYVMPKRRGDLQPVAAGSGFIFDAANGYVMTNHHVISEGEAYAVRLPDKTELEAKLVGSDPQNDIAVLKVEGKNLTAAVLGDSDAMEVGDWVLAVGNPFGFLEQTVTSGIISAKGRKGLHLSNHENYIQTDAAINRGNSGGPLVNLEGEVIGVNTAIYSESGGYQGIGFSIPINQAKNIAMQLVTHGKVMHGWMGVKVQDLTPQESKHAHLAEGAGASVEGVYLHGPAHQAGLLPGDILVKFNDKAVRNAEEIRDLVSDMEPGTQVQFVILRNAETKIIKATVGAQPKDWGKIEQE